MTMSKANPTALLVIDVQVGIIDVLRAYKGSEVIGNIGELLSRARTSGTPVIYIQHDGQPGDVLETGSLGWQIHPGVAPSFGEPVINKKFSDSFFETTLSHELETRGARHLIITGCETQYCIDTACRRAVSLGYDVTLVSDAHTTVDNPILKAEQVIAHHNSLLDGFDAGAHKVTVKPSSEIEF